jgi:hypothetical protein
MSHYYFHLRDGVDILIDEEGRHLDGIDDIAPAALLEARSIISDDARSGCIRLDLRIDVEDASHKVVYSLDFSDAVEIVPSKTA